MYTASNYSKWSNSVTIQNITILLAIVHLLFLYSWNRLHNFKICTSLIPSSRTSKSDHPTSYENNHPVLSIYIFILFVHLFCTLDSTCKRDHMFHLCILQVHPCCCKWHDFIFHGLLIYHHISHLRMHSFTNGLFSCLHILAHKLCSNKCRNE